MSRIPHLVYSREKRRRAKRSNPLGKVGFVIAVAFSLSTIAAALSAVFVYQDISKDLPSPVMLETLLDPQEGLLLQPTRIYDRSGEEVLWTFQHPALDQRGYGILDLDEKALRTDIPPEVVKAVLAVTDPDYFSRSGWGLLDWLSPRDESIPRMLVSELLLWDEPPGRLRGYRERILASQITSQYGKEQILEWYLNTRYFGHQTYGVVSASQVYFGIDPSQLNLAEAAMLVAISEAPALNPFDAPRAARERQAALLDRMLEEGLITAEERDQALESPLIYNLEAKGAAHPQPVFVEYVLDQVEGEIPPQRLTRGGFNITSSIDSDLQRQMECTVQAGISRWQGEGSTPREGCEAARLLPNFPGLGITEEGRPNLELVQLDPRNGQVLAILGRGSGGDPAVFTPHPPGTLLTPYIYLTSFTQGYEPAALVWDIPPEDGGFSAQDLHPACSEGCEYQGPVSIRSAMANDYLVPALDFWNSYRPENVENTLSQLGVHVARSLCRSCRIFQGSHEVNILDISQSFGVFSHGGVLRGWPANGKGGQLNPAFVLRVEDRSGVVWRENPRRFSRVVISKQLAYMVTHVLSDRNARRPSMGTLNVFDIGRPVAVKTGYTADKNQLWTVGYTPQLVTAVWVGGGEFTSGYPNDAMSKVASGFWRALTQYALKGQKVENWAQPPGLTTLDVCSPSGLLPTDHCPEVVNEIFIQGSEPTQRDNLYQVVEVNQATGRLATVFTPPELIEKRTYINVPPEARAWAEERGLSTPPREYDVGEKGTTTGEVRISTPVNFSAQKGFVVIKGSVPGRDLRSYRIQVGKGLNPKSWQQVGEEKDQPVQGGWLATWDTGRVEDGLYAIQLVVVREGQKVEKASVLVSIDNTSPTVRLSGEIDGRTYTYQPGEQILFQAQTTDNASLEVVKFYLNSTLAASRSQPPYAFPWEMSVGEHTLRVWAYDEAGNAATHTVSFEVTP